MGSCTNCLEELGQGVLATAVWPVVDRVVVNYSNTWCRVSGMSPPVKEDVTHHMYLRCGACDPCIPVMSWCNNVWWSCKNILQAFMHVAMVFAVWILTARGMLAGSVTQILQLQASIVFYDCPEKLIILRSHSLETC